MEKREISNYTRPISSSIGLRGDTTIASIILYSNSVGESTDEKGVNGGNLYNFAKKVVQPLGITTFKGASRDVWEGDLDGMGNNYYGIFNNIILTSVVESHSVIQKLHLNFSDSWNVFFFSDNPVMLQLSGGLLDSEEYPYYQEFMTAYENYLSGTRATSSNMSMILSYDGKIIDGYLVGVSVSTTAATEGYKSFQMQFLAKKITWTRYNYLRKENFPDKFVDTDTGSYNALSNVGRLKGEFGMDSLYAGDPASYSDIG